MKFSKRGSTAVLATLRYLRRKTCLCMGFAFLALFLYNYFSLIGKLSQHSESILNPMAFLSQERSVRAWKTMMLRNESRLGIHILRPETPIRSVIVLGERHSGTTFFTKYLSDCFPDVNVGDTFVNNKHWIQHDPDYLLRAVSDESSPPLWRDIVRRSDASSERISNDYFQNTLVLVLIRNPYDWIEAMRRKPWHWPNHLSLFPLSPEKEPLTVKAHKQGNEASHFSGGHSVEKSYAGHKLLDWKDFVQRPLYLEDEEETGNEASKLCQMGYARKTISPCQRNANYVPKPLRKIPKAFLRHLPFDTNNPIYEHNPIDKEPFQNIFELRSSKIRNFLSLPEKWELAGIGFIQYDNLLDKRLKSLTDKIASALEIRNSCPSLEPFKKAPYNLTDEYRNWITNAVQWDVEKLIGYYPHKG